MKFNRIYLALLGVILLAAGCGGNGAIVPLGSGSLTGYLYAKSYNNTPAAARAVARSAEQAAPDGYVAVSGATVQILNSPYSSVTTGADGKFTFSEVAEGTYTLRATKEGTMEPLEFTATVRRNETTILNNSSTMTMSPSATGTLTITATAECSVSVPVQGDVYVNDINTFATTPIAVLSNVAAGSYRVTVKANGYLDPVEQNVTIADGGSGSLSFQLAPDGNATPYAVIASPSDASTVIQGNNVTFSGTGVDCEDGTLTGSNLTWTSSIDGALGTGTALSVSTLSVGTHTITLKATDSAGAYGTAKITLTVTASGSNTAPTAAIVSPTNESSYTAGASVTFIGAGTDTENGILSGSRLVWTSSRDGQIGTGVSFSKTDLSVGTHTITLTVTDGGGLTDTASVTITVTTSSSVNNAPVAQIAAPISGGIYTTGTAIRFAGAAADTEDGTITGSSLVWTSNVDGQIGTGASFTKADLTQGNHTITLTATDSGGLTDTATVTISVVATSTANNAPVVAIAAPFTGSTYISGANILFMGGAADVEDGTLTGSSLVWFSDLDGQIGTGTNFQTTALSVGTHTITLIATDSAAATGSAAASITITALP